MTRGFLREANAARSYGGLTCLIEAIAWSTDMAPEASQGVDFEHIDALRHCMETP